MLINSMLTRLLSFQAPRLHHDEPHPLLKVSKHASQSNMLQFSQLVIIFAISCYLCTTGCSAIGSAESGRSKFGLYIVRSPETTIAPIGDEVVLECGLSVNPDRIVWRFLPQNASKLHPHNFKIIEHNSVRG